MTVGIYEIRNTKNGKRYIGSSIKIEQRLNYHTNLLESEEHFNSHLQSAWNRYGKDSFNFSILQETSPEKCRKVEQEYLDKTQPEYNIAKDATAPMQSKRHSKEAKQKIGKAHKNKSISKETKIKISKANKDHEVTTKTREKIRQSKIGTSVKHTPETKRKISKAQEGEKGNSAKLERRQVIEIKKLIGLGVESFKEIAIEFNVSHITISDIYLGNSWTHIPYQESLFREFRVSQRRSKQSKFLDGHRPKGEENHKTKLTEKEVLKIREKDKKKKFSHYDLADRFNVSRPTIDNIVNGKTWSHI